MSDRPSARPAVRPSLLAALPIEFIGSFPDPSHRLEPVLPEVAFLGRSNVGKSTLINAVTGRRGLARVSATPGKTQAMNVFRTPSFYLVDLPGYGYARTSKATKASLDRLILGYLHDRATATAVVWLLDLRRDPSEDDLAILEGMAAREIPVLAVLTKADKLPHGQRNERHRAITRGLGLAPDQVILTSGNSGLGIADLGDSILALAGPDSGHPEMIP